MIGTNQQKHSWGLKGYLTIRLKNMRTASSSPSWRTGCHSHQGASVTYHLTHQASHLPRLHLPNRSGLQLQIKPPELMESSLSRRPNPATKPTMASPYTNMEHNHHTTILASLFTRRGLSLPPPNNNELKPGGCPIWCSGTKMLHTSSVSILLILLMFIAYNSAEYYNLNCKPTISQHRSSSSTVRPTSSKGWCSPMPVGLSPPSTSTCPVLNNSSINLNCSSNSFIYSISFPTTSSSTFFIGFPHNTFLFFISFPNHIINIAERAQQTNRPTSREPCLLCIYSWVVPASMEPGATSLSAQSRNPRSPAATMWLWEPWVGPGRKD